MRMQEQHSCKGQDSQVVAERRYGGSAWRMLRHDTPCRRLTVIHLAPHQRSAERSRVTCWEGRRIVCNCCVCAMPRSLPCMHCTIHCKVSGTPGCVVWCRNGSELARLSRPPVQIFLFVARVAVSFACFCKGGQRFHKGWTLKAGSTTSFSLASLGGGGIS